MENIQELHQQVMAYLMARREQDPNLNFATRRINYKGRLDKGYWFLGDEGYLNVSFWLGVDGKERLYNIGFTARLTGLCYIEIVSQTSPERAVVLQRLVDQLGGFEPQGKKQKWWSYYPGSDILANLEHFIDHTIKQIDSLLDATPGEWNARITTEDFDREYKKTAQRWQMLQQTGHLPKLARICFNDKGWKFPSGRKGKSVSKDSYEFKNGFGHEEWLFDDRLFNGYKYSFVKALLLESDLHHGQKYHLTLYTRSAVGQLYLVATIKEAICINKEESAEAYRYYRKQGWIKEMQQEVEQVQGIWGSDIASEPGIFFNFKFLPKDLVDEKMAIISKNEPQIKTHHFVLLPHIAPLRFEPVIEKHGKELNKNLATRRRVYNGECEYDPYHDRMQKKIFSILKADPENESVFGEDDYVDIKVLTKKRQWHFYELKTDHPKLCIRKALGQLLEYACYPGMMKADQLIIVGPEEPDAEAINYLKYLRDTFRLPLSYRSFDLATNTISGFYGLP